MSLAELRARFLAMHDARRVARAEDAALFASALAVYQAAGARRELAEDAVDAALRALEAAREVESEWGAVVHGLAVRIARTADASGPMPPTAGTSKIAGLWEYGDTRPDRAPRLRRRGRRARRREALAALRLFRQLKKAGKANSYARLQ